MDGLKKNILCRYGFFVFSEQILFKSKKKEKIISYDKLVFLSMRV